MDNKILSHNQLFVKKISCQKISGRMHLVKRHFPINYLSFKSYLLNFPVSRKDPPGSFSSSTGEYIQLLEEETQIIVIKYYSKNNALSIRGLPAERVPAGRLSKNSFVKHHYSTIILYKKNYPPRSPSVDNSY
jgi:hypothetical protein